MRGRSLTKYNWLLLWVGFTVIRVKRLGKGIGFGIAGIRLYQNQNGREKGPESLLRIETSSTLEVLQVQVSNYAQAVRQTFEKV